MDRIEESESSSSASPPLPVGNDLAQLRECIWRGGAIKAGTLRHVVRHAVFRADKPDAITNFLHGYRFVAIAPTKATCFAYLLAESSAPLATCSQR